MSIKMPWSGRQETEKFSHVRHETFLKPVTHTHILSMNELHLDKIILNCKSIQRSVQTFFIPFYAVIVHTCVVILSSSLPPFTHLLARLLCSFQTSFIKYFPTHLSTTTTTRRHFCVCGGFQSGNQKIPQGLRETFVVFQMKIFSCFGKVIAL